MKSYMKLIQRLVRLVKAKQLTHWLYDQEEGYVDVSKVVRVVANPGIPMTYIREDVSTFKPTLFYFLIDENLNDDVYQFIYDFCLAMERAGAVSSEILGVKSYKNRIRNLKFDREKIGKAKFDLAEMMKAKFKNKILINLTNEKVQSNKSYTFTYIKYEETEDFDNLLNTLYKTFEQS